MTYLTADVILGRLTPAMAAQAVCLDSWTCSRAWHGSETTWRLSVQQQRKEWADTHCPQCGGRFVTDAEVAAALLTPDSAALPLAPVEGS